MIRAGSSRRSSLEKDDMDEKDYPWDGIWDYLLEDSELDDTDDEGNFSSRLAAIRAGIPITRSVSTRLRVSNDFRSDEDPVRVRTNERFIDLDNELQQSEERQKSSSPPQLKQYQLRGLRSFKNEPAKECRDAADDDSEEDIPIAQSLFMETRQDQGSDSRRRCSMGRSDNRSQKSGKGRDETSSKGSTRTPIPILAPALKQGRDDDEDHDRPQDRSAPPTSPTKQMENTEVRSKKWKKKWIPSKLLKKKGKDTGPQAGRQRPPGDDSSNSTTTPTSILVTEHMSLPKRPTQNLVRKSSGWPLNTSDMSIAAESTSDLRRPSMFMNACTSRRPFEDGSTTSGSDDDDDGIMESTRASPSSFYQKSKEYKAPALLNQNRGGRNRNKALDRPYVKEAVISDDDDYDDDDDASIAKSVLCGSSAKDEIFYNPGIALAQTSRHRRRRSKSTDRILGSKKKESSSRRQVQRPPPKPTGQPKRRNGRNLRRFYYSDNDGDDSSGDEISIADHFYGAARRFSQEKLSEKFTK